MSVKTLYTSLHKPPNCRALGGINFHPKPLTAYLFEISFADSLTKMSNSLTNSRLAPTKLVTLSDIIHFGKPLLPMNLAKGKRLRLNRSRILYELPLLKNKRIYKRMSFEMLILLNFLISPGKGLQSIHPYM